MLNLASFLRIPEDLPPKKHRSFAILTMVGVLGFSAHVVFLITFIVFEVYPMAYFNIASCFLFAVIFMANRKAVSDAPTLMIVAIGEIILHAIFAVVVVGWDSNFHYYLFLAMMTSFLAGRFNRSAYISNSIAFFAYLGLYFYTQNFLPLQKLSSTGMTIFGVMNLFSAATMVITITAYFNYTAKESTRKYATTNSELSQQAEELKAQSDKLEKANKHTRDSIKYALRIQEAMLPSSKELSHLLGHDDYMIFYSPKDIISGDFFWCKEVKGKKIIAVGDCTGHGVPGAMLTMIGESILNSIIEKGITQPSLILDALQTYFSTLFVSRNDVRDGMDISICTIDYAENILFFAGAKNPLVYIQNEKIEIIKGNRMSIGQTFTRKFMPKDFTNHRLDISVPTTFYMYSDGYQDQFGGEKNTKFYSKNLKKLLLEIHQQPMQKQRLALKRTLFKWRNLNKQTDDVTIIGFRIDPNKPNEKTRNLEEEILEIEYNNDTINDEIYQKQIEMDKQNLAEKVKTQPTQI